MIGLLFFKHLTPLALSAPKMLCPYLYGMLIVG
jgi:hypothetical protein